MIISKNDMTELRLRCEECGVDYAIILDYMETLSQSDAEEWFKNMSDQDIFTAWRKVLNR